jgi:hypothetical protein
MKFGPKGSILRKLVIMLVIAAVLCGGVYAGYRIWANWLLGTPLGKPQTSHAAAASGAKIIRQIKDPAFRPESGTLELEEIQINSVIEEEMSANLDNSAGEVNPNDVTAILAKGLSNPQVKIDDNSITIAANVDLKAFAPYIKEHAGQELPQEFQKVTPLRAVTAISIDNRVLKVNFTSLTLGNMSLKDSRISGMISDLTEKLETYLRQTVKSQIPGEFKEVSTEEMSYRLPDFVENIEVQEGKITITYKKDAGEAGTQP